MKAKNQRIPQEILDEIKRNLETMGPDHVQQPHIFSIIRNLWIRRGSIRVLKTALMLIAFIIIFMLLW